MGGVLNSSVADLELCVENLPVLGQPLLATPPLVLMVWKSAEQSSLEQAEATHWIEHTQILSELVWVQVSVEVSPQLAARQLLLGSYGLASARTS